MTVKGANFLLMLIGCVLLAVQPLTSSGLENETLVIFFILKVIFGELKYKVL